MRSKKKPSIPSIVKAVNARFNSPSRRRKFTSRECWACQARAPLERAHITADTNGGAADPSNFFLLCWRCHREQPDTCSEAVQWYWLISQEHAKDRHKRETMAIDFLISSMGNAKQLKPFVKYYMKLMKSPDFKAENNVAGHHMSNVAASLRWGLLDHYDKWLRTRDPKYAQKTPLAVDSSLHKLMMSLPGDSLEE